MSLFMPQLYGKVLVVEGHNAIFMFISTHKFLEFNVQLGLQWPL